MKKLLLFFVPFFLIGCASTNISSFRNPDIDFSNYKKIMVYGNSRDIDFQKTLEADLVNAFTEKNITAVSSIDLISPIKEYSSEEIQNIFIENNIDGYLSVAVVSATEESAYVPQRSHTNYRSQYVNGKLTSVPYTTTSGGYSVSYPKARIKLPVARKPSHPPLHP